MTERELEIQRALRNELKDFGEYLLDDTWLCETPIFVTEPKAVWYFMHRRDEVTANSLEEAYPFTYEEITDYWNKYILKIPEEKMEVAEKTKTLIQWIRDWFNENGPDCNAIIGISGGKDSTIVAALCVEALGADRVIGVLMPDGIQNDIEDSRKVCKLLGIKNYTVNIQNSVSAVIEGLKQNGIEITEQTKINLPPRIRMSTLYAIAQSNNGRVANTCNLSETMVGYETRWGDSVGDFSPLGGLTVTEVLEIGDYLNLPYVLVHKVPMDGLNIKDNGFYVTDEDNLGVSYNDIDAYIRGTGPNNPEVLEKIQNLVKKSAFKRNPISTFKY